MSYTDLDIHQAIDLVKAGNYYVMIGFKNSWFAFNGSTRIKEFNVLLNSEFKIETSALKEWNDIHLRRNAIRGDKNDSSNL